MQLDLEGPVSGQVLIANRLVIKILRQGEEVRRDPQGGGECSRPRQTMLFVQVLTDNQSATPTDDERPQARREHFA